MKKMEENEMKEKKETKKNEKKKGEKKDEIITENEEDKRKDGENSKLISEVMIGKNESKDEATTKYGTH